MMINSDEIVKYIIIWISSLITIWFFINFIILFRNEWNKYDNEEKWSNWFTD